MKKIHLILVLNASLIFNLFGFSSLSINKISLDNVVENDSSIDLIKSLNTSDIAISYLTLEGDYFYTGIDDKGNKKWSYKAQENWSGQFYVQDNIFIKDYEPVPDGFVPGRYDVPWNKGKKNNGKQCNYTDNK